jgi:hypothetical protein
MFPLRKAIRSTKEIDGDVVTLTIPVRTKPEMNASSPGAWWRRTSRSKLQKKVVAEALWALRPPKPNLPLTVTLIRISAGHCDSDGAVAALKWVRDEFARWVGEDDGREGDDGYTWLYEQEKCKKGDYGVRIKYTVPR